MKYQLKIIQINSRLECKDKKKILNCKLCKKNTSLTNIIWEKESLTLKMMEMKNIYNL